MGNELFDEVNPDAWHVSTAIELFHNFTLIHDDIMDKAPLRRGMETVHVKFGDSTALLAGDVMMVAAYDWLTKSRAPIFIRSFNFSIKRQGRCVKANSWIWNLRKENAYTAGIYQHDRTEDLCAVGREFENGLFWAGQVRGINNTCMAMAKILASLSRCRMTTWMLSGIRKIWQSS
jgi:hypothetical protein